MADIKPRFIPGTKLTEPISQNEYLYVEGENTIKQGDELVVSPFGVAMPIPPEAQFGAYFPPAKGWEYIAKGQFGFVLLMGSSFAQAKGLEVRAQKKAEQVLDLKSRIADGGKPGQHVQTRRVELKQ